MNKVIFTTHDNSSYFYGSSQFTVCLNRLRLDRQNIPHGDYYNLHFTNKNTESWKNEVIYYSLANNVEKLIQAQVTLLCSSQVTVLYLMFMEVEYTMWITGKRDKTVFTNHVVELNIVLSYQGSERAHLFSFKFKQLFCAKL